MRCFSSPHSHKICQFFSFFSPSFSSVSPELASFSWLLSFCSGWVPVVLQKVNCSPATVHKVRQWKSLLRQLWFQNTICLWIYKQTFTSPLACLWCSCVRFTFCIVVWALNSCDSWSKFICLLFKKEIYFTESNWQLIVMCLLAVKTYPIDSLIFKSNDLLVVSKLS